MRPRANSFGFRRGWSRIVITGVALLSKDGWMVDIWILFTLFWSICPSVTRSIEEMVRNEIYSCSSWAPINQPWRSIDTVMDNTNNVPEKSRRGDDTRDTFQLTNWVPMDEQQHQGRTITIYQFVLLHTNAVKMLFLQSSHTARTKRWKITTCLRFV